MKRYFLILPSLFLLYQCSLSPRIVRPGAGKSMLYVARYDALISTSDVIQIHFNNRKVAVMNKSDSYIALQARPGFYRVRFIIYNARGKRLERCKRGFDLRMNAGKTYFTNLKYIFGWRHGNSTVSETGFSGACWKDFLGIFNVR